MELFLVTLSSLHIFYSFHYLLVSSLHSPHAYTDKQADTHTHATGYASSQKPMGFFYHDRRPKGCVFLTVPLR